MLTASLRRALLLTFVVAGLAAGVLARPRARGSARFAHLEDCLLQEVLRGGSGDRR